MLKEIAHKFVVALAALVFLLSPVASRAALSVNGTPDSLGQGIYVNGVAGPGQGVYLNGVLQNTQRIWMFDATSQNLGVLFGGAAGENTRATTGTAIQGGVVVTVGSGAPGFSDFYGAWRLSIQPAATNLALQSNQFDTTWSFGANGTLTDVGDGSWRVQLPATGTTYLTQVITFSAGQHTLSVWVRATSGTSQFALVCAGSTSTTQVATEAWQRFIFTATAVGGSSNFGITNESDGYSTDIVVKYAQLETGNLATAYIPTVASTVSRAADGVRWDLPQPIKNLLSTAEGPATAEGTLVVRGVVFGFSNAEVPPAALLIVGGNDSATGLLYAASDITNHYIGRTYDGTTATGVLLDWAKGTSYDLAVRWSSQTNLMQVGYKLSSASSWTWGTAAAFDGAFTLGSYLNVGYSPTYPFEIGKVEFFDAWLSESQLAWLRELPEWVACADDYYPARLVAGL